MDFSEEISRPDNCYANQITAACENSVFPKQSGLTTQNAFISLNIHSLDTKQNSTNSHLYVDIFYDNTGKIKGIISKQFS